MSQIERITGVILAGGRGSRMGGVDKGLVQFEGKPLIEHAIERIRPQVDALMINSNRNHEVYARFGHTVFGDEHLDGIEEYAGPLAGMFAALTRASTDLVLIAPCDVPRLPLDLAARLRTPMQRDSVSACVAHDGKRMHPTCTLLRTSLRDTLRAALLRGERKSETWLRSINCAIVDFSDQPDAFFNLNTPGDLETLAW